MKKNYLLSLSILLIGNILVYSQQKVLSINYLYENLPDSIPTVFGEGIFAIKDYMHSNPEFSPKFDEIYWSFRINGEYGKEIINYIVKRNNQWSAPKVPSFSLTGKGDLYPTFSINGQELYFTSDRSDSYSVDSINRFIWKVKKNGRGWSEPEIVGFDSLDIYSLSISQIGTLYFMAQLVKDRSTMIYNIYSSRIADNKYSDPEKLTYPISTEHYEDGPFISKDEQFLIFESNRPGGMGKLDLYISKKNTDGKWSEPINLGILINSESSERYPYLSPDCKYFFFASNRSGYNRIYWVDSKFLYNLINN